MFVGYKSCILMKFCFVAVWEICLENHKLVLIPEQENHTITQLFASAFLSVQLSELCSGMHSGAYTLVSLHVYFLSNCQDLVACLRVHIGLGCCATCSSKSIRLYFKNSDFCLCPDSTLKMQDFVCFCTIKSCRII